jgi:hypothetical protein
VFVQKRTMRPQNDSSKKVEANPATTAASNSNRNDVEDVLKEPEVRCTVLPIKSFVRKTREVLSNTGPESLLMEEDLQTTTPQIERWLEEKSNMAPWCALRLLHFPSEIAV